MKKLKRRGNASASKFKAAVKATPPPVDEAWRAGLQALEGRDRNKVTCANARQLTGSIHLDEALERKSKHASANRWDYGLGYKPSDGSDERAVWVEVHTATTREVSTVLRKLEWLKVWLNGEAEELRKLTDRTPADHRFVWIARNGVDIPRNSRQARQLRVKMLAPRSILSLP